MKDEGRQGKREKKKRNISGREMERGREARRIGDDFK